MDDLTKSLVWTYLDEGMKDLMQESYYLLGREEAHLQEPGVLPLHDYSFVVFPAAKAFEGFLKKVFFEMGFITKAQYKGDRFRIGRSINPNLPIRYRWDWVFGKMARFCRGEELPREIWDVWKTARNGVFHFFPGHARFVTLEEAKGLLVRLVETMERVLAGCALT